jgi:hypothetical protein
VNVLRSRVRIAVRGAVWAMVPPLTSSVLTCCWQRRVSDLGGRVLHPPLDLKSRRMGEPGRHALVPIAGPPGG